MNSVYFGSGRSYTEPGVWGLKRHLSGREGHQKDESTSNVEYVGN